MTTKIQVREFSTMPELATEGWDPNGCSSEDYATPRAAALYTALGVDPSDDEYALARHTDGRWALFVLTLAGHRFAAEENEDPVLRDATSRVLALEARLADVADASPPAPESQAATAMLELFVSATRETTELRASLWTPGVQPDASRLSSRAHAVARSAENLIRRGQGLAPYP